MFIYVGINTDNRCGNPFFDSCSWCVLPRKSENTRSLQMHNITAFQPSMCPAVWGEANTEGDRNVNMCLYYDNCYFFVTSRRLCARFVIKLLCFVMFNKVYANKNYIWRQYECARKWMLYATDKSSRLCVDFILRTFLPVNNIIFWKVFRFALLHEADVRCKGHVEGFVQNYWNLLYKIK